MRARVYFNDVNWYPFDSDGDGLNDAVEVEMDVDTTYNGTITVHVDAQLRYNSTTVDSDSPSWSITDAEVEWGYAYLYVPEGSPEGEYVIFLHLFDQCWNSEDFWAMCCVYLYPPAMGPSISIYTDKTKYAPSETMHVGLDVENPGPPMTICFKLWVKREPHGLPYVVDYRHDLNMPGSFTYSNPSFKSFKIPKTKMPGSFTWHAEIQDPTTHAIIVKDTAEFSIS